MTRPRCDVSDEICETDARRRKRLTIRIGRTARRLTLGVLGRSALSPARARLPDNYKPATKRSTGNQKNTSLLERTGACVEGANLQIRLPVLLHFRSRPRRHSRPGTSQDAPLVKWVCREQVPAGGCRGGPRRGLPPDSHQLPLECRRSSARARLNSCTRLWFGVRRVLTVTVGVVRWLAVLSGAVPVINRDVGTLSRPRVGLQ